MAIYVCASAPNLGTWLDLPDEEPVRLKFKNGQLTLDDEKEVEAFDALLKHRKCRVGAIVRKLDRESAEEFARNFQRERAAAVRGPITSTNMAGRREGEQMGAIAKMRADGVPESEIETITKQLGTEESLLVSEDTPRKPAKPTPAKIPSLNVGKK